MAHGGVLGMAVCMVLRGTVFDGGHDGGRLCKPSAYEKP